MDDRQKESWLNISDGARREQLERHKEIVNKHLEVISLIQETCSHSHVKYVNEANTGNWCPDDDSYWVRVKCQICGKFQHIDSEDPEYRKYTLSSNHRKCEKVEEL